MEEIRQWEAAVIRRVCYMVNTYSKDFKTLSEGFCFTGQLAFDKWYENSRPDSRILASFYQLYLLASKREEEVRREEARMKQELLLPASKTINEMIDLQNKQLDHFLGDQFLLETMTEGFVKQGYSYDYAQRSARECLDKPDFMKPHMESLVNRLRPQFEGKAGPAVEKYGIQISSLWSPSSKRYRHVTLDELARSSDIPMRETKDALGLDGMTAGSFSEYQYLLAVREIMRALYLNDSALVHAVRRSKELCLLPEQNEDGLPGAKWDALQTVFSENPDFEKDLIALFHYCAYNEKPNIKESWLFRYADFVPLNQSADQKEAENLFAETARNGISSYFRAAVSFVKCTQMRMMCVLMKAFGGEAEQHQSVAELMKGFHCRPEDFRDETGQTFISDLITVMKGDGLELDTTGMERYLLQPAKGRKGARGGKSDMPGAASGGVARNKWIALLLCLFLGLFGAHKFYEKKTGMGVLYLFTAGLFGIGAVIDFFALLFKPNPYDV